MNIHIILDIKIRRSPLASWPLNIAIRLQGIAFLICYMLCAMPYALCYADEPASKEPIVVNGDKVEYFHEKKEVVGTGNISITYKDVILTCEKITVHLDTREAEASGNVRVRQKDAFFTGEKMSYNFDTRKGTVISGYLDATPFYGKAKVVDKIANKDQFNLERGYVATCDLDKPHYRIQSRQVKVYLEDKVVAKHILLFVGNVPVLYMPYYVQPLKEKKSHITLISGESRDWGYYLLSAYRYYITDDSRGDILLDYRAKKGLSEGLNHYIDTKEVGNGAFKFYYTHENDNLVYQKVGPARTRYRYQYRHKWDMEDLDTTALVEFNKLSDTDIVKDYLYYEYEESGSPDNYISVITTKEDYTTELLLRKRFDKFFEVVERLPEYRVNIYNYKIADTSFYYHAQASGSYLNKTFDNTNTSPAQKDINTARIDAYNQLSYAARFFRSLNMTPYTGVRETYYSRGTGEANKIRTVFNSGVNNSIKFYRIYDVKTNFLDLDINGLRHIITPSANYYYVHRPTVLPSKLNQFDEVDAIGKTNGVTLALENRLQTKRLDGERMVSVDLATLIIGTDYLFRLEKNNRNLKNDRLTNIDFQLELIPYSWAYIVSKMSVNPKKYNVETLSVDLVATGYDKWSLAMSYRFEDTSSGTSGLITLDGMYKISEKWRARIYERFDTTRGAIEEQEYTIYRDLHCWIAELTYNIKNLQDRTLRFILRLKAFPEYQIGVKRTYSRPRFGSTGTH